MKEIGIKMSKSWKGGHSLCPFSSVMQQPVSKQSLLGENNSQVLYCCILWNIPWSDWVSSPGCVPSQPLGHLQPSHCGWRVRNREGLDTAQWYSVHWIVFPTVLVMNPKHSTILAAMKKINSIPTKPSTASLWLMGRKQAEIILDSSSLELQGRKEAVLELLRSSVSLYP